MTGQDLIGQVADLKSEFLDVKSEFCHVKCNAKEGYITLTKSLTAPRRLKSIKSDHRLRFVFQITTSNIGATSKILSNSKLITEVLSYSYDEDYELISTLLVALARLIPSGALWFNLHREDIFKATP